MPGRDQSRRMAHASGADRNEDGGARSPGRLPSVPEDTDTDDLKEIDEALREELGDDEEEAEGGAAPIYGGF